MMILSFVVTCLVSLRALRLRTLVIHSIIVIHSSPHCVDARFALASLALLSNSTMFLLTCTFRIPLEHGSALLSTTSRGSCHVVVFRMHGAFSPDGRLNPLEYAQQVSCTPSSVC